MSEPLVIIGNGMAAARLADELAKRALGKYAVAIIGDEPRLAYNRVLLSSMLAGDVTSDDLELKPAKWWRDRGVTLSYDNTFGIHNPSFYNDTVTRTSEALSAVQ